jgi:hypothetical protein
VTHLRVDRGEDPPGPGAAIKPRDVIVIDVEVLADQFG